MLSCCFMSMEARWPIWDGDRVGRGGQSGKGTTEWRLNWGNPLKKTGETMDCHQNNGSVKVVSPRHCPATCALRNCCFNCCAWTESQRQCPLHCCWWTTRTTWSKRRPTCSAQLHLPTHDLFWANLKVQFHLPPLRSHDLAWNLTCFIHPAVGFYTDKWYILFCFAFERFWAQSYIGLPFTAQLPPNSAVSKHGA